MKQILYFIRHAESDIRVKEDAVRPLTAKGFHAALLLVDRFADIAVQAVYASPYLRVIQTVEKIAGDKKLGIITAEDLREREIGCWLADFFSYAEKQWADFDFKLKTGESLKEVQQRNITSIKKILDQHPQGRIIVGTHGTSLSTIINFYESQL